MLQHSTLRIAFSRGGRPRCCSPKCPPSRRSRPSHVVDPIERHGHASIPSAVRRRCCSAMRPLRYHSPSRTPSLCLCWRCRIDVRASFGSHAPRPATRSRVGGASWTGGWDGGFFVSPARNVADGFPSPPHSPFSSCACARRGDGNGSRIGQLTTLEARLAAVPVSARPRAVLAPPLQPRPPPEPAALANLANLVAHERSPRCSTPSPSPRSAPSSPPTSPPTTTRRPSHRPRSRRTCPSSPPRPPPRRPRCSPTSPPSPPPMKRTQP